jgi:dynein heavy chain
MGWAVPYGFSGADLRISTEQIMERLQMMPEEAERGAGTPQLPLKWLRYAVGALNYGGRVTDARDRRTLLHVLSGFLCDGVLTDGHAFSPSGVYASPPDGSLKEYRAFIEKLPINDAPEVFGLHGNAELTLRLRESQTLLANANIMVNGGGAGALGAEKEAQVLKAAARIGAQLPTEAPFDAAAVLRRFPPKYEESMNTVLVNEVRAWQALLLLPSAHELRS